MPATALMWSWSQRLGELYNAQGERIATGYSGHGEGVNNGAMQSVENVGPIPQGTYAINSPRDVPGRGPYVLPLTASPTTETFGRGGFLIHGDEVDHVGQRLASHGCIILARAVREQIWTSGDHDLQVTA